MKLGSEKVSGKSRPQGFRTNPSRAPACRGLGEQPGEREGLGRWSLGGGQWRPWIRGERRARKMEF